MVCHGFPWGFGRRKCTRFRRCGVVDGSSLVGRKRFGIERVGCIGGIVGCVQLGRRVVEHPGGQLRWRLRLSLSVASITRITCIA